MKEAFDTLAMLPTGIFTFMLLISLIIKIDDRLKKPLIAPFFLPGLILAGQLAYVAAELVMFYGWPTDSWPFWRDVMPFLPATQKGCVELLGESSWACRVGRDGILKTGLWFFGPVLFLAVVVVPFLRRTCKEWYQREPERQRRLAEKMVEEILRAEEEQEALEEGTEMGMGGGDDMKQG